MSSLQSLLQRPPYPRTYGLSVRQNSLGHGSSALPSRSTLSDNREWNADDLHLKDSLRSGTLRFKDLATAKPGPYHFFIDDSASVRALIGHGGPARLAASLEKWLKRHQLHGACSMIPADARFWDEHTRLAWDKVLDERRPLQTLVVSDFHAPAPEPDDRFWKKLLLRSEATFLRLHHPLPTLASGNPCVDIETIADFRVFNPKVFVRNFTTWNSRIIQFLRSSNARVFELERVNLDRCSEACLRLLSEADPNNIRM